MAPHCSVGGDLKADVADGELHANFFPDARDWAQVEVDNAHASHFGPECDSWTPDWLWGVSPMYSAWACQHMENEVWQSLQYSNTEPMKIPITDRDEEGPWGRAAPSPAIGLDQLRLSKPPGLGSECRWHKSANSVGIISSDGHIFTKTSGGQTKMKDRQGNTVELASICMIFDETLRVAGQHRFDYTILDGELGAADGVGFVFDTQVRRNNIQRMRSVFLNRRGQLCVRDQQRVQKLGTQLPPLAAGMQVFVDVDLESSCLKFSICDALGMMCGFSELSAETLFDRGSRHCLGSGFFCAVVTKEISVRLM